MHAAGVPAAASGPGADDRLARGERPRHVGHN
jgi:hypothetical protein